MLQRPKNVIPFPDLVLTEASLKQPDEDMRRAALTYPIPPGTPKEVLVYTARIVLDALPDMMERGSIRENFESAKQEITQAMSRLIEITERIPDAPSCPEARLRLHKWFVHEYPF